MTGHDDGPLYTSIPMSTHESDQAVAEYRGVLLDLTKLTREHFEVCDVPGCPGGPALSLMAELIAKGPSISLTALAMSVYLLAKGESLDAPDELEELLRATKDEEPEAGEAGRTGESESDPS